MIEICERESLNAIERMTKNGMMAISLTEISQILAEKIMFFFCKRIEQTTKIVSVSNSSG